jgi:hypothetical protein
MAMAFWFAFTQYDSAARGINSGSSGTFTSKSCPQLFAAVSHIQSVSHDVDVSQVFEAAPQIVKVDMGIRLFPTPSSHT